MRRIIERKVTVVTTTTWTISWQDDSPHSSSEADVAQPTDTNMDDAPATPPEIKEADLESDDISAPLTLTSKVIDSQPNHKGNTP